MTVMEHFTDRENLVVTWVGDGNNVLHDLMLACTMLGIDFRYAVPEGYEPAEMSSSGLRSTPRSTALSSPEQSIQRKRSKMRMSYTQTSSFRWVKSI